MIVLKVLLLLYALISTLIMTIMLHFAIKEKLRLNELIAVFKEIPIDITREIHRTQNLVRSENSASTMTVRDLRKQRELIDIYLARLGDDE